MTDQQWREWRERVKRFEKLRCQEFAGSDDIPERPSWQSARALLDERDRYREALREFLNSGIEHDDLRLGYLTIQVNREVWGEAQRLLGD